MEVVFHLGKNTYTKEKGNECPKSQGKVLSGHDRDETEEFLLHEYEIEHFLFNLVTEKT